MKMENWTRPQIGQASILPLLDGDASAGAGEPSLVVELGTQLGDQPARVERVEQVLGTGTAAGAAGRHGHVKGRRGGARIKMGR